MEDCTFIRFANTNNPDSKILHSNSVEIKISNNFTSEAMSLLRQSDTWYFIHSIDKGRFVSYILAAQKYWK